jgi:hypothetical protein
MSDEAPEQSDFILYTAPSGEVKIEVFFADETVWLTQKRMAELFGVEVNTVNYHLKEIFKSGELDKSATIRKIRIVQDEGGYDVRRNVDFYSLDAIISVGYRVNSDRATQFRKWATSAIKTFAVQGYVLGKKRFENGNYLGKDYFEKLLAEVREIRASEHRLWLRGAS